MDITEIFVELFPYAMEADKRNSAKLAKTSKVIRITLSPDTKIHRIS